MKKIVLFMTIALVIIFPTQVLAVEEPQSFFSENTEDGWNLPINDRDLKNRYDNIMEDLIAKGFGEMYEQQYPEFKGYSIDSVQLFQNTYGDLWENMQMDLPSIPDNFSASIFLEQGMEMRNNLFGEVKSSDIYQSVMNQIDIGNVWKKASGGLPSASSLLSNSFRQDFLSGSKNEKEENHNQLAEIQEGSLDLFTQAGGLLSESNKKAFWSAVEDMKDILSSGNSDADDVIDKMK